MAKMCLEFKMGITAKGNVMQASERLDRRISRGFPEKALLCLTIYWESLAKAPDKVPTSQENLFCAGAEKRWRVRQEQPR